MTARTHQPKSPGERVPTSGPADLLAAPAGASSFSAPTRRGEAAFGALLCTLERLSGALAAPASAGCPDPALAGLAPIVCGAVAHLRAAGVAPAEVVARLTAAVAAVAPPGLPPRVLRARVAAVVAWCEEAHRSHDGPAEGAYVNFVNRVAHGLGVELER